MSTFTQIYYHIVFGTFRRQPVMIKSGRDALYRCIWGIIKNHHCHLYRINGVEDHFHIFTSLHPTVCLADLVKDVKLGSESWLKTNPVFPHFDRWQEGYGAFTISHQEKDALIEYIKNQEEHHQKYTWLEEYKRFLQETGVHYDEKYLT